MRSTRNGPYQGETHVISKSSEKGNNIEIRHIASCLEELEKYNREGGIPLHDMVVPYHHRPFQLNYLNQV